MTHFVTKEPWWNDSWRWKVWTSKFYTSVRDTLSVSYCLKKCLRRFPGKPQSWSTVFLRHQKKKRWKTNNYKTKATYETTDAWTKKKCKGGTALELSVEKLLGIESFIWVMPCENVSLGICGQRRHRSACTWSQSDQGLLCPLTESLDTEQCISGEQMPRWDLVHAWDECESAHFYVCWRTCFCLALPIWWLKENGYASKGNNYDTEIFASFLSGQVLFFKKRFHFLWVITQCFYILKHLLLVIIPLKYVRGI